MIATDQVMIATDVVIVDCGIKPKQQNTALLSFQ